MYQTVVYQGEPVEFAPDEGVEQPETPTLRDPEDDQLSEYDDDSSDNKEWKKIVLFVMCRTRNSVSFCSARNTYLMDSENN